MTTFYCPNCGRSITVYANYDYTFRCTCGACYQIDTSSYTPTSNVSYNNFIMGG